VLALADVWKVFSRGREWVQVLQGVSLTVNAGEIVAVVGTRDQGKTTLVRVAGGMLEPEQGTVRLRGRELGALRDRELARVLRTEIGIATRTGPELRVHVGEYVELPLVTGMRLKWRERRRSAAWALELAEVTDCVGMCWRDLSNWQRVRVELAQAIVSRPGLLLVDDVLDGFGLGKKQAAMDMLRGFAADLGCGVLMVASDHIEALPSDRIWQLEDGKLKLMADLTDPDVIPLHKDVGRSRVWYAEP
jgi:ABC-type lipoprotein export system ATPase subunit